MDFGCGVGRTLVNFREEAELAEIWGVDVDADALAERRARSSALRCTRGSPRSIRRFPSTMTPST